MTLNMLLCNLAVTSVSAYRFIPVNGYQWRVTHVVHEHVPMNINVRTGRAELGWNHELNALVP
ncbi:hypothetical protein UY286_10375 [Paenibacillus polymyxa]|uniref:hypothetical protein n=1 Tax=Paenibacillus polymyxa TaxID=1406 RepID=UPI002AB4E104|nr:hypothetical protein [Paenibacillus polymyxa]MDY8117850.1 hypothetical protein [Paenibacillus polymyxa]